MNALLGGSFRIGRFAGIDVRVHILFVIWIVLELIRYSEAWGEYLAFAAMLFVSVLLHEFGHCFGARSVGGYADQILMWPLGGLAYCDAPRTPWAQFVTVACGPAVNLVLAAATFLIMYLVYGSGMAVRGSFPWFTPTVTDLWTPTALYVWLFFQVNAGLFLFNVLLPIYPFDGGRLLQIALWLFMGELRATILACKIGIGGAIVLAGIGLGATGGDTHGWYIAIAAMGAIQCWQTLQAAKMGVVWDERITRHSPRPIRRGPGWWAKLMARFRRPKAGAPNAAGSPNTGTTENPNPGGWDNKLSEEARLEAEVDRILKKVHDQGMNSLTYTEKQSLERARRKRLERERELQGGGKT